jgi:gluconolactonase
MRVITHEVDRPNGILVSPGDERLYVADNNNNTIGGARKLWRFALKGDGTVDAASRRLIFDWKMGRGPDGIKMDRKGRLFVAAGRNQPQAPFESADEFKGGVYVLGSDGTLLDFIPIPVDEVTNCAFGGSDLKTLFITAGGTLWSIAVNMLSTLLSAGLAAQTAGLSPLEQKFQDSMNGVVLQGQSTREGKPGLSEDKYTIEKVVKQSGDT